MLHQEASVRRYTLALITALAALAAGCGEATEDTEPRRVSSHEDHVEDEETSSDPASSVADIAAPGSVVEVSPGEELEEPSETDSDSETPDPDSETPADDEGSAGDDDTTEPSDSQPDESGSDSDGESGDAMAFLNESDTRAMWVWSESPSAQQLVENVDGAQDELMEFAAAPHGDSERALNRLFFEARGHSRVDRFSKLREVTYDPIVDPDKQEALRAFNKRAHAQGMDVEYLDGQAIWVASDANAEAPKQVCKDVANFNRTTNDVTERFDGIHFDIEPHTVREGPYAGMWWENKLPNGYNAEWTQRWKDIMTSCRATFDEYEADTGHKLVLASDVGTDYAYYNKPILDFFNGPDSPVDYMGIMNYYDNGPNADGKPSFFWGDVEGSQATGGVEQNLDLWTNTPLLFGVETGPTSIAPDYMSFYQEGYNAMYSVVDQLEEEYGSAGSLGIAIHHYSPDSYKDLKP